MRNISKLVIKSYQRFISPTIRILIKGDCRFTPTCSEYSYNAIEKYGTLRGGYLAFKRILRCNPLCISGYDPVR